MVKVLFIDDDPLAQRTLGTVLPDPYALLSAYTARQGIDAAARERPDVILLDFTLPDMDGIAALRELAGLPSPPPVVMLTAMSAPRVVKEAILAGARDWICKPYDLKELLGALRTAVAGADARRAAASADGVSDGGLLGESPGMGEMRDLILRYAPSDSPVLLLGESGTGKEMAARLVHDASRRRGGPFVALNCGALPETLLETELFGAERGAFTDAVSRPGSFERATGGTLFLDEVGELSPAAQTRLLRVIEQRELTRVGGTRTVPLDVRVVSATNRDLKDAEGGFRADLYYRLGVLPVRIPPLRERRDDVAILALHFLARLSRPEVALSAEARQKLARHPWPGNVRELRNVMERAVLAAQDGTIRARDILFD
jgi:two-component system, NtrC family, response regulator AtoC